MIYHITHTKPSGIGNTIKYIISYYDSKSLYVHNESHREFTNRPLFMDIRSSWKCPITSKHNTQTPPSPPPPPPFPLQTVFLPARWKTAPHVQAEPASSLHACFQNWVLSTLPPPFPLPFSLILLPSSLPFPAPGLQTHLSASHLTRSSHGLLTQFPPGSQGSLRSPV